MIKTWRWFGKNDAISLSTLRQIGVEGVVTALHHIPNGEIWSYEEILDHKTFIENAGLHWHVVESLSVSEAIKYGASNRDQLIDNYIHSLENLAKAGIKTICYNFMPVIDWIRTDLNHKLADGTSTLLFDKIRFAYFDIFILERKNAKADYSDNELEKVNALASTITQGEINELVDTIIVKTQGFINGNIKEGDQHPVAIFNRLLALYDGIDKNRLRENLTYFLKRIMPTCEQHGINMCIHPDDPPYQMLGLPRIVSSLEDIEWILNVVNNQHNGFTFCAGSLSAGVHNDVSKMAEKLANRTHFVHLRSTDVQNNGNFMEASHLEGRGHLIELVKIFETQHPNLPMRVDHGKLMLDDACKGYHPGYSFHGRMFALAQMDGVIATVKHSLNKNL